ncbi:MAG: sulfatase-like hydrolase/transferase [Bryobacteraceae bacterium]
MPLLAQGRRPNFIVICTDDQGGRDLGCFGATDLKTPHIDALAASGTRFTNWYSNAPVCAPSRAALMTGRYPVRAGVPSNGPFLPPSQRTTATLLKNAGYSTALVGKWHLGSNDESCPNAHGFEYFYGFHIGVVDFYSHRYYWGEPNRVNFHDLWRNRAEIFEDGQYLTEGITQESLRFIDANRARPFFLTVTYNAPHYPMHAPEKYTQRFPELAPERRMYAAMLAGVDDGVGEIRAALKRHGLLENTLIFWIVDNGATTEARAGLEQKPATAGDNGTYRGFKFSLFDGGMHVPAIMSWPGAIRAGQVNREIVMTMDILPTICAAAGVRQPDGHTVDGRDILGVARGEAKSPHDAIFWEQGGQLAARRGRWKLVLNGQVWDRTPEGRKPLQGEDAVFLSDLEADPGETKNLRRAHPEIVDDLTGRIHRWREDVRRP